MGVFGIFRLKGFDPDVFEKELTQLTKQISTTQEQIYTLKGKSKQWIYSLSKIFLAVYGLILVYTYQSVPRSPVARNRMANFIRGQTNEQLMVLVGFPMAGYLIVYMINYVFHVSVGRRERYLKGLKKKHAQKIEELKKITNFNTTNELLNKYGPQEDKKKPKDENGTTKEGEKAKTQQNPKLQSNSQSEQQQQIIQRLQNLQANPPVQAPRTFQDRVLDFIVGSDNNEATENRYALICRQCLTHNGLAPPGCTNPFEVSYICPNCGFLNGEIDQTTDVHQIETELLKENKHSNVPQDPALHRPLIDNVMDTPSPENVPATGPVETTLIEPKATHTTSFNSLVENSP